ncbi:MAG: hypothetical protein HY699_11335 [Deltaproteobacteria bacterium]|nr:hypothetical protein [Deltaproteobacteria bacterium]
MARRSTPSAGGGPARFTRLAWMVFIASSALYFLSANEADNDLWGHLRFGQAIIAAAGVLRHDPYSYTVPGAPWMNHEWLSQVLFAGVYAAAGDTGLWCLKLAVGLATLALLLVRVRRERVESPWVWGPVALLVIAVLARGLAMRPQIFTYLGLAVLLAGCDRRARPRGELLWLPLLFVLWANLHGGFILGLVVLALVAAAAAVVGPAAEPARALAALLLATAATVVNPYGWRLLAYIAGELTVEHPITEWQPATAGDASQTTFFVLLALFVLTLPWARWRARPWEIALAIGCAVMALRHQRHTPVFALTAAVAVTAQLAAAVRRRPWRVPALSAAAQRALAAGLIAIALAQVALQTKRLVADRFHVVFDPRDYPTEAVRALAASGVQLNLAVPLDWGEYVLWHLAPRVKVSLDGRFATLFPPAVVRDNFAFFAGGAGWQRLITAYPTDAALVPRAMPCPIRQHPGWLRVYGDGVAEIFARADRAPALHLDAVPAAPPPGHFP